MSNDKNDQTPLTDHDYDGIREYDNPLPAWWLATFFGAIIFAYIYYLHYASGAGTTQLQELAEDIAELHQKQHQHQSSPQDSEENLAKLASAGEAVTKGHDIFIAKCAVCHGQKLEGSIGPNLTDTYWIHGKGQLSDIAMVIRAGVPDKGMPGWETQLADQDIQYLAVFVASAKGSNPSNAKPPQGSKVGN